VWGRACRRRYAEQLLCQKSFAAGVPASIRQRID